MASPMHQTHIRSACAKTRIDSRAPSPFAASVPVRRVRVGKRRVFRPADSWLPTSCNIRWGASGLRAERTGPRKRTPSYGRHHPNRPSSHQKGTTAELASAVRLDLENAGEQRQAWKSGDSMTDIVCMGELRDRGHADRSRGMRHVRLCQAGEGMLMTIAMRGGSQFRFRRAVLVATLIVGAFLARPATAADTWYVSPTGDDDNNDGKQAPFATCFKAASVVGPGDTVIFADGEYANQELKITTSGTADAWITFKARNKHGAKITNTWYNSVTIGDENAIGVGFVIIDGFELVAPATYGSGVGSGYGAHHIIVRNCWAHDCGQSGISLSDGDYRVVENNIVNNNGWIMPLAGSGISMYGLVPFDDAPGFHSIVRGNIC
ncbi:MAG: hypothetical protein GF331_07625, partial [Chitinivibrionales bacterium]|nr:hypothetical protein [Chitinivibrionales bacterium]